jgi:hypothetical protein
MRTKPIVTEIKGKQHLIVYIEYHDRKPHAVITLEEGKYMMHWDFDLNLNWGEYMHYNSGGGGDVKSIQGPQFAEYSRKNAIWIAECVRFNKYKPKNCIILKSPIRLQKNGRTMIDPFKFSYQEVLDIIYCDVCEGHYNEDGCQEHMDMWEYTYRDGRPIE